MDTLLAVHSFIRWIIMAVAVVAIVKFAVGWLPIASSRAWIAASPPVLAA